MRRASARAQRRLLEVPDRRPRPGRTCAGGRHRRWREAGSAGLHEPGFERGAAGPEQVEQHAQGVDVGRRRDLAAMICSGAAYAGVRAASPSRVCAVSRAVASASSSFAMPKSSSFTCPSFVTSTLDGLRSRCTTRFAWACATASSTSRNRRCAPGRRVRARRSSGRSARRRCTPGRGRAGRAATAGSMSWAMCGCASRRGSCPRARSVSIAADRRRRSTA